jgi:hypothetical protein
MSYVYRSKLSRSGCVAGIITAFLGYAELAAAQDSVQLNSPALQANASIPQHNRPGTELEKMLSAAKQMAPSRGVEWKGLDIISGDAPGAAMGYTDGLLIDLYKKYTCIADAVVVGHVGPSLSHLSAYGTAVYSDYALTVESIVKDNHRAPITMRSIIVITRPGGSMALPSGPVKYISQGFPSLTPGSSYLQFLRFIPESGAYNAIDEFATFVSNDGAWHIIRKAMAGRTLPVEFRNGIFQSSIAEWLRSCK